MCAVTVGVGGGYQRPDNQARCTRVPSGSRCHPENRGQQTVRTVRNLILDISNNLKNYCKDFPSSSPGSFSSPTPTCDSFRVIFFPVDIVGLL